MKQRTTTTVKNATHRAALQVQAVAMVDLDGYAEALASILAEIESVQVNVQVRLNGVNVRCSTVAEAEALVLAHLKNAHVLQEVQKADQGKG